MLREGFKFEILFFSCFQINNKVTSYVQNIFLAPNNDKSVGWFIIIFSPIFMVLV